MSLKGIFTAGPNSFDGGLEVIEAFFEEIFAAVGSTGTGSGEE